MVRRVADDTARVPRGDGRADRQSSSDRAADDADPEPTGAEREDDLDGIQERRTLADVVDAAALGRWLPPAWNARTDVTKFGTDPVTEVLVLAGRGHRIVVDPVRTVAPTGPATCYVRPATAPRRREVATLDSLHEALATALEYITDIDEQVDPVTPVERHTTNLSGVLSHD